MSETPPNEDLLRYDILTQEALMGVIRRVLDEVSKTGLPGEHHFFITFDTTHSGVKLSDRMRERYPEEMTIVVQHTFWNLQVDEDKFEIDLSFDDIRERLCVPFNSVRGFFDPSVKFGLQFDLHQESDDGTENLTLVGSEAESSTGDVPATVPPREIVPVKTATKAKKKSGKKKPEQKDEILEEPDSASADVVSLDAFRKKK